MFKALLNIFGKKQSEVAVVSESPTSKEVEQPKAVEKKAPAKTAKVVKSKPKTQTKKTKK